MGTLKSFLGVAIRHSHTGFFLSHENYAEDIFERAGMSDCKPILTPVDLNGKLPVVTGPTVANPSEYQSLTGALQYLTVTRSNLSYAIQQACLHMYDPTVCLWYYVAWSSSTRFLIDFSYGLHRR
jgi:hypothetical protein